MISLMRNPQLPLPKRVRTMTMSDKPGLSPPFTCVYYQGCLHLGSGRTLLQPKVLQRLEEDESESMKHTCYLEIFFESIRDHHLI